jgi:hypothetical protein
MDPNRTCTQWSLATAPPYKFAKPANCEHLSSSRTCTERWLITTPPYKFAKPTNCEHLSSFRTCTQRSLITTPPYKFAKPTNCKHRNEFSNLCDWVLVEHLFPRKPSKSCRTQSNRRCTLVSRDGNGTCGIGCLVSTRFDGNRRDHRTILSVENHG